MIRMKFLFCALFSLSTFSLSNAQVRQAPTTKSKTNSQNIPEKTKNNPSRTNQSTTQKNRINPTQSIMPLLDVERPVKGLPVGEGVDAFEVEGDAFAIRQRQAKDYKQYVNPFIGTGGHGHTFPGAVAPFGMVQLSPDTRNDASWDACGGYYYNDSTILGFSHTHLSGTGVSDLGDILFQPTDGPKFDPKEYREAYLHRDEVATPGYYSVRYRRTRIRTELTASDYTGIQRYEFSNPNEAWVIIDLEHRDQLLSFSLDLENFKPGSNIEDQGIYRIRGHRQSKAWANNQWVFFVTEFSQPILKFQYNENKTKLALCFRKSVIPNIDNSDGRFPQIPEKKFFDIRSNSAFTLEVRTTISFTSLEGAEKNEQFTLNQLNEKLIQFRGPKGMGDDMSPFQFVKVENKNWSEEYINILGNSGNEISKSVLNQKLPINYFELMKKSTEINWNSELSRIKVDINLYQYENGSLQNLVNFYTALYHTFIHPSLASDCDGNYRGRDQKLHTASHRVYHVFSLWDTYRTLHPLLTLVQRQRTREFVRSMLLQYKDGGKLPVWELGSCETNCMIGFHSVPVIAEALAKGIDLQLDGTDGLTEELLVKAIMESSNGKELSYQYAIPTAQELLTIYNLKLGYIDVLKEAESVSKTLEYAYDDFCTRRVLELLDGFESSTGDVYSGKYDSLVRELKRRENRWMNLCDSESKSFRPKHNGQFLSPFQRNEVNNHYTEANAWQYSLAVQHNVLGLFQVYGGYNGFKTHLDTLFYGSSKTSGREQADISGLIGQYAHGNEPSHHMAYLYNYLNRKDQTQKILWNIYSNFYKNSPDGLIGNEDCGQMSAWYVMSALGIYPVAPGTNQYELGLPLFPRVQLFTEQGDTFTFSRDKATENELWFMYNGLNPMHFELNTDGDLEKYLKKFENSSQTVKQFAETEFYKKNKEELFYHSTYVPRIGYHYLEIFKEVKFKRVKSISPNADEIRGIEKQFHELISLNSAISNISDEIAIRAEITSPRKVKKGERYTVDIKPVDMLNAVNMTDRLNGGMERGINLGTKEKKSLDGVELNQSRMGLHVFVRLMNESINNRSSFSGRTLPGQFTQIYVLSLSDTAVRLNLTGPALIWAAYGDTAVNSITRLNYTASYVYEQPNNYEVISIMGKYNPQYSGGGDQALIDGVLGSEEWRAGGWQGYQSQDFECVIDLKELTEIKYLGIRFLADQRAWIFEPKDVEFYYSEDGKEYKLFNRFDFRGLIREETVIVPLVLGKGDASGLRQQPDSSVNGFSRGIKLSKKKKYKQKDQKITARYIKVKAKNFGKLPPRHPGYEYNGEAFIFVDEILINPEVMELL